MSKSKITKIVSKETWLVNGDLTMDVINHHLQNGLMVIKNSAENLKFDFSGVEKIDSSGVAMLITWLKSARQDHREIEFCNLPESMSKIIALANLDKLLPITSATNL